MKFKTFSYIIQEDCNILSYDDAQSEELAAYFFHGKSVSRYRKDVSSTRHGEQGLRLRANQYERCRGKASLLP
jgi:hypothetical protein